MNILLIGSGGREHALAWKIVQSPHCDRLFASPGNPGIAHCGSCVTIDVTDPQAVIDFCRLMGINFVVVGPEAPLVAGLVDALAEADIAAFGPTKAAAQLEGSKGFTKDLCREFDIPTAAYERFSEAGAAHDHISRSGTPIVVKADGLAAGKGVIVAMTEDEAHAAIDEIFGGAFGSAGAEVVIEDFLEGEEVSFFVLCDGKTAMPLGSAQDHKRAFNGDEGPNTGGMGAYSPAPVFDAAMQARVMREIIEPTLAGMTARGVPFKGVLFAGLMITADGPKLIEYNVRFGDPECQVLLPRLRSDLLPALLASALGTLHTVTLDWHDDAALAVVMAAKGYPGAYAKGTRIQGLAAAEQHPDTIVFHAGTRLAGDQLLSNGGRVLAVTATGNDLSAARDTVYGAIGEIDWPDGFFRTDIGWRALPSPAAE